MKRGYVNCVQASESDSFFLVVQLFCSTLYLGRITVQRLETGYQASILKCGRVQKGYGDGCISFCTILSGRKVH